MALCCRDSGWGTEAPEGGPAEEPQPVSVRARIQIHQVMSRVTRATLAEALLCASGTPHLGKTQHHRRARGAQKASRRRRCRSWSLRLRALGAGFLYCPAVWGGASTQVVKEEASQGGADGPSLNCGRQGILCMGGAWERGPELECAGGEGESDLVLRHPPCLALTEDSASECPSTCSSCLGIAQPHSI